MWPISETHIVTMKWELLWSPTGSGVGKPFNEVLTFHILTLTYDVTFFPRKCRHSCSVIILVGIEDLFLGELLRVNCELHTAVCKRHSQWWKRRKRI